MTKNKTRNYAAVYCVKRFHEAQIIFNHLYPAAASLLNILRNAKADSSIFKFTRFPSVFWSSIA